VSHCRCPSPRQNHRRPAFCSQCGVGLDPKWISSDENLAVFLTRLADLPGVTPAGLLHAQTRERAGRVEFGLKYLGRDNIAEGQEEAADGSMYAYLEWLNDRRRGAVSIDPELLTAAHHFSLAHAALERRGSR